MTLVLKADAAAGDAYVTKASLGTAGATFAIEMRYAIEAATLPILVAAYPGQAFTGDIFDIGNVAGSFDAVFGDTVSSVWYFETEDGTAFNTSAPLLSDTWQTIRYEATFVSGTNWSVVAKVNGSTFDTYTADLGFASGGTLGPFRVGSSNAANVSGNVQYVDDVQVESPIGTVVFSDDFESGTLAAWDSTSGSASVISDPIAGGTANDSCASAVTLTGLSGTVTADNTAWSGTWPTGGDPLWNSRAGGQKGGGAPLWWKWTNTLGYAVDFVVAFRATTGDIDVNGGLAVGSCGALDMTETAFVSGHDTNSLNTDFDLADTEELDVIVHPGETVYLEMDSYDASVTTEPPVASIRGHFTFDWSARSVTFFDAIIDSEVLVAAVTTLPDGVTSIGPLDAIEVDGRVYFAFTVNTDDGDVLWAGDCLDDGSDLHVQEIAAADRVLVSEEQVQLVTDGESVWLGFPEIVQIGNQDDSCDLVVIVCEGLFNEETITHTPDMIDQYVLNVYKWDAGAWSIFEFFQSTPTDEDAGPMWGTDQGVMLTRFSASSADPGAVWAVASYQVERKFYTSHFNNYPFCTLDGFAGPHGHLQCIRDLTNMEEYFDVFRTEGAGPVLERRDSNVIPEEHLVSYDPTVNPIFGAPDTHADDPWLTWSPGDPMFPSILRRQMWVFNDTPDGIPVVASSIRTEFATGDETVLNTITMEQAVSGVALSDYAYDDYAVGTHTSLTAVVANRNTQLADLWSLYVSPKYTNDETGGVERIVTSFWSFDASPDQWLINRMVSSVDAAPEVVEVGNIYSSVAPYFGSLPERDGTRNFWLPVRDGTTAGTFWNYDRLCSHQWVKAYDPSTGPDAIGFYDEMSKQGAWLTTEPPAYIELVQLNEVRKYTVKRDYWICAVGDVITVGGLFAWQRF